MTIISPSERRRSSPARNACRLSGGAGELDECPLTTTPAAALATGWEGAARRAWQSINLASVLARASGIVAILPDQSRV